MKTAIFFVILSLTLSLAVAAQTGRSVKATAKSESDPNPQDALRGRTEQFLLARQARKGPVMRGYFDPEDIKDLNKDLKLLYAGTKEGMGQGQFPPSYVKDSVERGDLAEPYKEAILKYLLNNADFDRELNIAFNRYLSEYSYKIVNFQI